MSPIAWSARSPSAVLYMNSVAGEKVRLPCDVLEIEAIDLLARSRNVPGCGFRLILNEGAWQTFSLLKAPRMSLGRFPGQEQSEGCFDHGLLARKLTVLDLHPEKPLEIISQSEIHGESHQNRATDRSRATCWSARPMLPHEASVGKSRERSPIESGANWSLPLADGDSVLLGELAEVAVRPLGRRASRTREVERLGSIGSEVDSIQAREGVFVVG